MRRAAGSRDSSFISAIVDIEGETNVSDARERKRRDALGEIAKPRLGTPRGVGEVPIVGGQGLGAAQFAFCACLGETRDEVVHGIRRWGTRVARRAASLKWLERDASSGDASACGKCLNANL